MIQWLFVACGGAVGACCRFGLGMWLKPQPGKFPIATFSANVLGCLMMGILYVVIVDRHLIPAAWRPPLMVGFLGALTTFSSFAIEALGLWQTHHNGLAAMYVVLSVCASLFAAWVGYSLAEIIL
jgi:CrcB protein